MPFYEYECTHCKFYVEALQKISDPPLVKCPSCGEPGLKRLVSAPNFRLKGSGWYETDFKSDKENKRNIAGGEEDKPSTEKESKEGEDKPARISRHVAVRKIDKKVKSVGKKAARKAVKKKQAAKPAKNAGKGKVKSRPQSKPKSKLKAKVKSGSAKKKSVKKKTARKK